MHQERDTPKRSVELTQILSFEICFQRCHNQREPKCNEFNK